MEIKNKRENIVEYGNFGARPVTSAAANLKNADDYGQKPKTSALDAKLSKAFHDMQGQKLPIKAGIERSTIPDEIDEIAGDYDYGEEHGEYGYHFTKNLRLNQLAGNVPFNVKQHDQKSMTRAIKNAPTSYLNHHKLAAHVQNHDVLHTYVDGWEDMLPDDRLTHVKETTWNYKKEGWEDKYGENVGREKFDQHFNGLVDHIRSGKNDQDEHQYPSIMVHIPDGMEFEEDPEDASTGAAATWSRDARGKKYYTIGGNTRSMIHQALGKKVPVKIIKPFQSVQERYQINDIRYKAKLLIEKKEEELYVQKKRKERQWKEWQRYSKKASGNKTTGVCK